MLMPFGFGVLSRQIILLKFPSGNKVSLGQLFAAYVAPPSCAARCLVRDVMLVTIFLTASLVANLLAPILASRSTSLFARQSVMDKRVPSGSIRSPTARIDRWAGIQASTPPLIR